MVYRWDIKDDSKWDTEFSKNGCYGIKFDQTGKRRVKVQVRDIDGAVSQDEVTVNVIGENNKINTLVDPRDGNIYRIVNIEDKWWMAENLRIGKIISDSLFQLENNIIETYKNRFSDSIDSVGGVYRWLEAINYHKSNIQGICPDGWHIPTYAEWNDLFKDYPKIYCLQYYGQDGLSKLNLHINNGAIRLGGYINWYSNGFGTPGFWTSSFLEKDNEIYPGQVTFNSILQSLNITYLKTSGPENNNDYIHYYSVRCLKDY